MDGSTREAAEKFPASAHCLRVSVPPRLPATAQTVRNPCEDLIGLERLICDTLGQAVYEKKGIVF